MNKTERMANLAESMLLTPFQAVAIPALIEVCAKHANMSEDDMIAKIERIPELRNYLSTVCKKAMQ